jgi:autotransporter-associated beta strand protein
MVRLPVLPACLLLTLVTATAPAQTTYTWTGGGVNGNWSAAANWGGTAPPTSFTNSILRLAGTTNTATVVDAALPTSTVGGATAAYEIRTLVFAAGGGPFSVSPPSPATGVPTVRINTGITVESGNTNAQTISTPLTTGSTGNHVWQHDGTGTLTVSGAVLAGGSGFFIGGAGNTNISGVISSGGGFNGMTFFGPGTVTLSGANTYGGVTTVQSGTLKLAGGNDRLPTTTRLQLGAGTTTTAVGTFDLNGRSQSVAGLTTLNGEANNRVISTTSTAVGTLRVVNATNQTFAGTLGGTGGNGFGLTKAENGVLTLTRENTYTGPTVIQSGTLKLSGTGSFANTSVITVGQVTAAAAILEVSTTTTNPLTGGVNFDSTLGTNQFLLRPNQTLQGSGRGVVGGVTVGPGAVV